MSRRGRAGGKHVTGMEIAALMCQGLAAVMLFGILFIYISARTEFEPGEEYVPVTITYTESEKYTETYIEDGKERTRARYNNSYYYIVDGVQYDGQVEHSLYGIVSGDQAVKYYNPQDPGELSDWQSIGDVMRQARGTAVAAFILEVLAVVFYIRVQKQKKGLLQKREDYAESIRQDIQNNQEIYQAFEGLIEKERLFTELEPLRKRIHKNQRAVEKIKERAASSVSGIIVIYYLIMRVIDKIRLKRIQSQLDMDAAYFYKEYKKGIAEPILNRLLEEVQYRPSQGFPVADLEASKLITKRLSEIKSEDYIEGVYKGIRYRQADIRIEKSARNSELLNELNGIEGRMAVYDFTKPIQGEIIIKTKLISAPIGHLEKVVMENLQFNEMFEVYASDAHMVFYVLTPQFMEYLLQLKLWGETAFRFVDDKLFVFRNQVSGMFEPDMGQPLDITYEIAKSYNEVKEIIDFIDALKLEQKDAPVTDGIPFEGFQDSARQSVKEEETAEITAPMEKQAPVGEGTQEQSNSKFRLKLE